MSTFIFGDTDMNFNLILNKGGEIMVNKDGKLTPSLLYTIEAEESKKKSEEDLSTPDPDKPEAQEIIKANIREDKTE